MNIEPFIFYEISLITAVLGVSLAVIAAFYAKNAKRLHELEEAVYKQKLLVHKKSEEVLDEAYVKAKDVIDDASTKATHIIKDANVFQKDVESAFKKEALGISEKLGVEFSKVLDQIQVLQLDEVRKVIKEFESEAKLEVKEFRNILDKETVSSQKIVEQKIEEEYKSLQNDLVLYKKQQMEKVDAEIGNIIKNVTEEVTGKGLNLEQHEELILQSLEEAKKNLLPLSS